MNKRIFGACLLVVIMFVGFIFYKGTPVKAASKSSAKSNFYIYIISAETGKIIIFSQTNSYETDYNELVDGFNKHYYHDASYVKWTDLQGVAHFHFLTESQIVHIPSKPFKILTKL